ncbi:cytochrome b-c1 complex subunit 7-like [Plodia interpunctella]|uniref:cytochrome b-c1 complex subunit 7-like n=1 Tax=Plodia interpunctella TaxID=58824 RepID=UPI002367F7F3|nr:cytochrome b-c1 complex subunit 7-like [Plodia interpunctella]
MALRTTAVACNSMKKWAYSLAGFNRYGLMRDDVLYETEDVQEALRRLPNHVIDERNFRLIRAVQLNGSKVVLPKEEWTKLEEDYLYLSPMVEVVKKERLEREKWESVY